MKRFALLICGGVLAVLAGCETLSIGDQPVAAPQQTQSYRCNGTNLLTATYTGSDALTVQTDGKVYKMTGTIAASGARYETPGDAGLKSAFWSKGSEAMLEVAGQPPLLCKLLPVN